MELVYYVDMKFVGKLVAADGLEEERVASGPQRQAGLAVEQQPRSGVES